MSESLTITLPDGSQKIVPEGSSPLVGQRLARDAVVARDPQSLERFRREARAASALNPIPHFSNKPKPSTQN